MKAKFIALLVILLVSGSTDAQIVISSSELLQVNTVSKFAIDTNPPVLNLGVPGFGNVWDFTGLHKTDSGISLIRDVDSQMGAQHFPMANLAILEEDSTVQYFTKTQNQLEFKGLAIQESNGDTTFVDLNLHIFTFPSIYNTTFTDYSNPISYKIEFGVDPDGPGPHGVVDSLEFRQVSKLTGRMDAQGTLKLPLSEVEVIRQLNQTVTYDSLFMYENGSWKVISDLVANVFMIDSATVDSSYTFRFLADETSYPMAELNFDIFTGIVFYAKWAEEISVGIQKNESSDVLRIYPNPASDFLQVDGWKEGMTAEFNDLQGRAMSQIPISSNGQIDVRSLTPGTYLLTIKQDKSPVAHQVVQITR